MTKAEADDAEVDAVIEEFGGDAREAIRALLHDLAVLSRDVDARVSHGYVRGRLRDRSIRSAAGGPSGAKRGV